ncbi:unnamed protein product [Cylicocyclus nassatus]|uniref:Replication-associated protein ORF2/G2P domain-containing protein n=1 Tax=Cylicocyclus nassatus TaxID=53992 RepID=A0AA36DNS2_CYLNA|nr:unnamed protein product [Cylicocyclus nassatus]
MRNYQDYFIGPRQNNDFIFIPVPCGKCVNCIDNRQSEKVTRALMETYTSGDVPYYVTLTYNPLHLPKDKCLRPTDTVNFLKRLRQKLVRLGYDCKLKYYLCGEYGSKFGRPHYHALIWGIPSQLNYKEVYNLILSAWSTYKLDKDNKRIKQGKTYLFEELGFVYVTRPKLTDPDIDKQVKNLVKYVTKYLQKANVPRTNDNKSVRGRVYDVRQVRSQEPTSSYVSSAEKSQIDEINNARNQDIQFDQLNKEWYKYTSRVQSQRAFPVDTMEIRLLGFVPRTKPQEGEKPNRIAYDLSYSNSLTMKFGKIYPTLVKEVLPGDSFEIKDNVNVQFMPMMYPITTRMRAYTHYFYVRNRTLWKDWQDFITGTKSDLVFPTLSVPNDEQHKKMFRTGGIGDYLGIPTRYYSGGGSSEMTFVLDNSHYDNTLLNTNMQSGSTSESSLTYTNSKLTTATAYRFFSVRLPNSIKSISSVSLSSSAKLSFSISADEIPQSPDRTPSLSILGDGNFSLGETEINKIKDHFPDNEYIYLSVSCPTANITEFAITINYDASSPYLEQDAVNVNPTLYSGISALPFRAYEAIYNTYFRNPQNNPFVVNGVEEYNKFVTTYTYNTNTDFSEIEDVHRLRERDRQVLIHYAEVTTAGEEGPSLSDRASSNVGGSRSGDSPSGQESDDGSSVKDDAVEDSAYEYDYPAPYVEYHHGREKVPWNDADAAVKKGILEREKEEKAAKAGSQSKTK